MATDAKKLNSAKEVEDERQKLLQHLQDRVNTADNDMTDLARAFDELNAKLTDGSEWVVVTKGQDIDDDEKENSHFAKLKEIEEKKLKALKSLSKLIHFIHADREDICAKESLKTCTDLKIDSYLDDINPDSVKKKGDTLIELLEEQNERLQQKYMLARDHVKIVSDREKLVRDAYNKLNERFKAATASKDTGVDFLETHFDNASEVNKNLEARTTRNARDVVDQINKNKNQHDGKSKSNASMQYRLSVTFPRHGDTSPSHGDTSTRLEKWKPDGTTIELTDFGTQTANTTPVPDDPEKMAADSISIDTVDTEVQTTIDLVHCGMQTDGTNELEGENQQGDPQLQERVKQLEKELVEKTEWLQSVHIADAYDINIYKKSTGVYNAPEYNLRKLLSETMDKMNIPNIKVGFVTDVKNASVVCCIARDYNDWISVINEIGSSEIEFTSTAAILMYDPNYSRRDCEKAQTECFDTLSKFRTIITAPYNNSTLVYSTRAAVVDEIIDFVRAAVVPKKKVTGCARCRISI